MDENINHEWFTNWFNSPYYHLLYEHRNEEEAALFLANLFEFLKPSSSAKILDMACGTGRHAIFLNTLGYDVTGADLSVNNISQANNFSGNNLRFVRHDMRKPILFGKFDIILNLFTSIGYFQNPDDNLISIKNMADVLNDHGILIIDFFNTTYVLNNYVKQEVIKKSGIEFFIERTVDDGRMYKKITFTHHNEKYFYCEQVSLLELKKFQEYLSATNLQLIYTFGDYKLNPYHEKSSERLILVAKK